MATWAKIKFYYNSMLNADGAVVSSSSIEPAGDYDTGYLSNSLEINSWKAASTWFNDTTVNGDFEAGVKSPWFFWVDSSSAAIFSIETATPYAGTYNAKVTITDGGSAVSKVQLYLTDDISIVSGNKYTVRFAAKAAALRTIYINIQEHSVPYTAYGLSETVSLTTSWQLFTYDFIALATSSDVRVNFQLGSDNNDVELDAVEFRASSISIDYTANGQISNGDFETGNLTDWGYSAGGAGVINAVTVETASPWQGSYYAKIDIAAVGTVYSDIKFNHNPAITGIKKGRVYKLLFACKAQAAATIQLVLRGLSSPYTRLEIDKTQAVTASWAHYEVTFTAAQDMDDLGVFFYIGNGAAWYEFDNIVFAEEEAVCADYAIAHGHNLLPETGAPPKLKLEYSDDNTNWTAVDNRLDGDTLHLFGTALWEFTKTGGHKYWKWSIVSSGATPEIRLLAWGLKTELDYASASFDPHAHTHKANVNVSYGGYVTGVHEQFIERRISLKFNDADSVLYVKIKRWIDTHGLKNFFVAWELVNEPNEIFLMRPEPGFENPLSNGGAYRDININLTGRKQ